MTADDDGEADHETHAADADRADPADGPDVDRPASTPLPRRPPYQLVLILLIGAVFGAVATLTWTASPSSRTVTGTVAAIDDTGSAILLAGVDDLEDVGLGIVGVTWRTAGSDGEAGEWVRATSDAGFPTCLTPDDVGRAVRVGLVTDPGGADRPPSTAVAWLECGPR